MKEALGFGDNRILSDMVRITHRGRVTWLVKEEESLSFLSLGWHVCTHMWVCLCVCVCVFGYGYVCEYSMSISLHVYVPCLAGMCASWLHLEVVWDKLSLFRITWDSATCMPIRLHMRAFVCEHVWPAQLNFYVLFFRYHKKDLNIIKQI